MTTPVPRYYTSTSTRDALIEESKTRIAENALKREYRRLVALDSKPVEKPKENSNG